LKAQTKFALPLLVAALLAGGCDSHTADDRNRFLTAEAALDRGDVAAFEEFADSLRSYPLYPYLRYRQIAGDLGNADPETVAAFLADHADTPHAARLRAGWLARLAAQGHWDQYVRFYLPDDSRERRCQYLYGLLRQGRSDEVYPQVASVWLHGRSLPGACDPVLDAWKQAGFLTDDLVWRRVALAMETGQSSLARYLGTLLAPEERVWVERWRDLHRDPRQILGARWTAEPHPYRDRILTHALVRLAPDAPRAAADAWDDLARRIDFAPAAAENTRAALGFALLAAGDEARGLAYLDAIPARVDNLDLQDRRLQAVLQRQDWEPVARWTAAMPDGPHKADYWLYWQARAAEILGQPQEARALFERAAAERSLWGFLAAERAARPYRVAGQATPADPQRLLALERSAALARMRELEALGRPGDLEREWRWLTRDMDHADLMAAAVVAERRGWSERAIFTLAESGYWDDIALRFPLEHRDIVRDQARATGLDAALIYAVLRQESVFDPRALSPAGARGLMQLMPATAREVAQELALAPLDLDHLFDPRLNITLGSHYLARMIREFGGNPALATAAYNAGPKRVARWIPAAGMDADVWIATIPFRETRGYVRRVLAYRVIYDHRLGTPVAPLLASLGRIGGS